MSSVSETGRQIWLLLLAHGGWWTTTEVRAQLALPDGVALERMRKLRQSGALAYRPAEGSRTQAEYAVLPHTTVPEGITVGEVLKAAGPAPNHLPVEHRSQIDAASWLSPAEVAFAKARHLQ